MRSHPRISATVPFTCVLALTAYEPLAGQAAQPPDQTRETAKPPDPARALARRIAEYAGGVDALRGLSGVAFRQSMTTNRRNRETRTESLWLLAPGRNRARWESLPAKPAPLPAGRIRGTRFEIMVLDTTNRKNLVTVPAIQGRRPQVSLWSNWHSVQRLILLPRNILAADVKLKLTKPIETDRAGVQRLRVIWPKTRNYEYTDEHELVVESDTGRILELTEISGTRGQNRAVYAISQWTKAGTVRLPTTFKLRSGRGSSHVFEDLRTGFPLPENAWTNDERFLQEWIAKSSGAAKKNETKK